MDPSQFDRLARGLASLPTRRGTLLGMLGGLILPLLPDGETDARNKNHTKNQNKTRQKRQGQRRDNDRGDTGRDNQGLGRQRNGGGQQGRTRGQRDRNRLEIEGKKNKKKKCKAPSVKCGKACIDVSSDAANCGGCGNVCTAGQACQGGACTCNGVRCSGCCDGTSCQAGTSDQFCGADGLACEACAGGRTCQGGVCACAAGQIVCNYACVDPQTNSGHCGACEAACPGGTACVGGACACGAGNECDDGLTCCDGSCRDLDTSTAACGTCGNACGAGADRCVGGACKCGSNDPCGGGQTCCNGTCKSLNADTTNCGRCGNVCGTKGNQCVDGVCACGGGAACGDGQTCCSGTCKTLTTDMANCGFCGANCTATLGTRIDRCTGGSCRCGTGSACATGQTCCNGACKDVATDQANCGTCGTNCSALGARVDRCAGGQCRCGASGNACPLGETCCGGSCKNLNTDVKNCGACGSVCIGSDYPQTTNVVCQPATRTCTFGCTGANYNIDNNPNNGCETADPQTNHTRDSATDLGSKGCRDDVYTFYGSIYSDPHAHDPAPSGFNTTVKAAPLWYRVFGTGSGGCANDPGIDLFQTGGTASGCYAITIMTDGQSVTIPVTGGRASYEMSSGSYPNNSWIHFKVEKTCQSSAPEKADFQVNFHL